MVYSPEAFNPPPRHVEKALPGALRGYVVRTADGWGIVTEDVTESSTVTVELDWREEAKEKTSSSVKRDGILETSFCRLGDSVDTVFGSGVVINFRRADRIHVVRLWRPWGAGSSTLYCTASMLKSIIPGAVGFTVKTPHGDGVVRAIGGPAGQEYTVELWNGDRLSGSSKSVCSKDVHCPEARALPVVDHFSLHLMSELRHYHGIVDGIRQHLEAAGLDKPEELIGAVAHVGMNLLQDVSSGIKQNTGDKEMDDLLDKGLNELKGFLKDRNIIDKASNEDSEQILKKNEEGLNVLLKSIGAEEGLTPESLALLADKDPKLLEIIQDIEKRQKELEVLGQQIEQTKTSQVFVSSAGRLEERLKDVMTNESPELQNLEKRTQKFLDRLMHDEKLQKTWKTKSDELVHKFQGNLAADNVNLEQWIQQMTSKLMEEHLKEHKDFFKGLESLEGLDFKKLDFEQLAKENWEPAILQTHVQKVLAEGFEQAQLDVTGTELLEQFSGKEPLVGRQLVQQTSSGLISQLEELGIEIPGPIRAALEQHAGGQAGDNVWESALVSTLEDDGVAKGASELVANTEGFLEEISKLKKNEVVLSILKSLEDIDFEDEILEGLASFDPELFLKDCEDVMTSHEARTRLVDGLLDAVLSFVLKVLPAIKIPEVSGEHADNFFRIRNLDMSGLTFKKEHVKLFLEDPQRLAHGNWRAVELLKFECKHISAEFKRLACYVKQLKYPNGETEAMADASASDLSLKLGFKVRFTGDESLVLDLSRLEIEMNQLSIQVDENDMAWLINPVVVLLNPLWRHLICRSLKDVLAEPMNGLCLQLNALLANAKPMLAKIGWPPKGLDSREIRRLWQNINVFGGTNSETTVLTVGNKAQLLSLDARNEQQRFWITQGDDGDWYHIKTVAYSREEKQDSDDERPPVFLSTTNIGGVGTWGKDDGSGRQRWILDKCVDGDWYHIKVFGGTIGNKRFLSASTNGEVGLWGEDDESGRQRWILTAGVEPPPKPLDPEDVTWFHEPM